MTLHWLVLYHACHAVLDCSTALQDLARAHIESCDAVFVLCNKAPADAKQEDLQTQMACLAIGQYIQVCIHMCVHT
jgi:hypothetical protein